VDDGGVEKGLLEFGAADSSGKEAKRDPEALMLTKVVPDHATF